MKVTQIASILNEIVKETLGESATIVNEDLSNIVDVGKTLPANTDVENYTHKIIDKIGKTIFVNREYKGEAPSVLMDSWEYGSILEKIRAELPDSEDNPAWSLVDGQTYNQDIFTSPEVSAKFFNSKTTSMVKMSFADDQVHSAFTGPSQVNAFFAMIENMIQTRRTIDYENLIFRTVNNMIGATAVDAAGGTVTPTFLGGAGNTRFVNLLYRYNQATGSSLKAAECLKDLSFIRYAALQFSLTTGYMRKALKLYNIGKTVKHSPTDRQHIIMLNEFKKSADVYLQSDTFHNEFTKLPNAEGISFWQGTGSDLSFSNVSSINVSVFNPNSPTTKQQVVMSGILGVIFDRDALGVCNVRNKVRSHVNNPGEFVNYWYKSEAAYFNDWDENFVCFYVADAASGS